MEKKPVRVRFAPSPTGHMHLGSARTALFDYLLARKLNGKFILRIEDTDRKRFVPGSEEELMNGLHWLGMMWDEGPDVGGEFGPYRQSERKALYLDYAKQLIREGHAYYCFCTPDRLNMMRQEQQKNKETFHYDGTCRNLDPDLVEKRIAAGEPCVIRFKTPDEGKTTVVDAIRGEITIENRTLDDFVLVKSDGFALYHLAVVVDDHLMKITHVIRGAEWLPTFPLHSLITRAFGWEEPEWVHLSVFLKPSGKGKMSKREAAELVKDGYSIFIKDLRDLGYIPEGVINWIALMGWSYDDHTEIFTMQDLVDKFSLEHLNPAPAAINFTKLDHFNGMHIRRLSVDDLAERIKPFYETAGYKVDIERLKKITPIIQERLGTLDEAPEISGFFFKDQIIPDVEELIPDGISPMQSLEILRKSSEILSAIDEFRAETAEPPMRMLVDEMGLRAGQLFGVLRIAITGQRVSPPLFESMEIMGREKVINQLDKAIHTLEQIINRS